MIAMNLNKCRKLHNTCKNNQNKQKLIALKQHHIRIRTKSTLLQYFDFMWAVGSQQVINKHNVFISNIFHIVPSLIFKLALMIGICIIMTLPISYFNVLSFTFKLVILIQMYCIPLLYGLLFFLDAGTVIQDQDQNFDQQRFYCITCKLYRNLSTKHCSFCNKCCKKYDHHCSVFGKCIGKRNLAIFYIFLIDVSSTFVFYFIAALMEMAGGINDKSNREMGQ